MSRSSENNHQQYSGLNSQGHPDARTNGHAQGNGTGPPRPSILIPEAMPEAKGPPVKPILREQEIPEKHDHRFLDNFFKALATVLGILGVKRKVVTDSLVPAAKDVCEWEAQTHLITAAQENVPDQVEVANAPTAIKNCRSRAERCMARATKKTTEAARLDSRAEKVREHWNGLPPALRGSEHDLVLVILGNLVVAFLDLFVMHLALGLTTGSNRDHWLTAAAFALGVVLLGDALGWMAAAGAIDEDGSFHWPNKGLLALDTGLLGVAVLVFLKLGTFRSATLQQEAHNYGLRIADPAFFTTAQIAIFIAAAMLAFAYVARRTGRDLRKQELDLLAQADKGKAEAQALVDEAENFLRTAEDVDEQSKGAKARIDARKKIGSQLASRARKQGDYLAHLVAVWYEWARAKVETGIDGWQTQQSYAWSRFDSWLGRFPWLTAGLGAALATLAAYLIQGETFASLLIGTVVGLVIVLLAKQGASHAERQARQQTLALSAQFDDAAERATDIVGLQPSDLGGIGPVLSEEVLERRNHE